MSNWTEEFSEYFKSDDWKRLSDFIKKERKKTIVLPNEKDVFNAFKLTDYDNIQVVLLDRNPMYNYVGLSYALSENISTIPSSVNKLVLELEKEYDTLLLDFDYSLSEWLKQGVFCINESLTQGLDLNHKEQWKNFFLKTIESLNKKEFLIWIILDLDIKDLDDLINPDHLVLQKLDNLFMYINNTLKFYNKKQIKWV